jgi:catechol 2,3-dioxygenase-like lactoylglutathione lyase family enzyme
MQFAHLTIATGDLDATCDFYEHVMGWERIHLPTNVPMSAAWFQIADGQQLHILHFDDYNPSSHETEYGRHLAIMYDTTEFDALKARLSEAGNDIIPPKRPTPFDRFFCHDPNGYSLEVIHRDQYVAEQN